MYVSCDSCGVWARGARWPSQLLSPEYWLGDRAKAEAKEKHHRASIPPPAEPSVLAFGMKSWPAEMGGRDNPTSQGSYLFLWLPCAEGLTEPRTQMQSQSLDQRT